MWAISVWIFHSSISLVKWVTIRMGPQKCRQRGLKPLLRVSPHHRLPRKHPRRPPEDFYVALKQQPVSVRARRSCECVPDLKKTSREHSPLKFNVRKRAHDTRAPPDLAARCARVDCTVLARINVTVATVET
jgi:hypothetical protein